MDEFLGYVIQVNDRFGMTYVNWTYSTLRPKGCSWFFFRHLCQRHCCSCCWVHCCGHLCYLSIDCCGSAITSISIASVRHLKGRLHPFVRRKRESIICVEPKEGKKDPRREPSRRNCSRQNYCLRRDFGLVVVFKSVEKSISVKLKTQSSLLGDSATFFISIVPLSP